MNNSRGSERIKGSAKKMKNFRRQVGALAFALGVSATFILLSGCSADLVVDEEEDGLKTMHERMVATQIEARGITDPGVLSAMRKVKRHLFVPESLWDIAYGDHPLPIGEGQTISQPYIVALMTLAVEPSKDKKVLEVGTGSGYQAAVLAELCGSVYSVEIIETLGKRAQGILAGMYDNVHVKIGDGYKGWSEHAPFDAVIVTCSPTHVPQPLIDQLKDGGRIIIPVHEDGEQELVLLVKRGDELMRESIIPVRFVPMVDDTGATY